jgi:biotin carboxyl carrier protein
VADVVFTAAGRRVAARVTARGEETTVRLDPGGAGRDVGTELHIRLERLWATAWRLTRPDGTSRIVRAVHHAGALWVHVDGETLAVRPAESSPVSVRWSGTARPEGLASPMPGAVTQVAVREGDTVAAGQPVVIVEAMKMEHVIRAPHAGRVKALRVRPGDQVDAGAIVADLTAPEAP